MARPGEVIMRQPEGKPVPGQEQSIANASSNAGQYAAYHARPFGGNSESSQRRERRLLDAIASARAGQQNIAATMESPAAPVAPR
jgi:hypothetical protein